MTTNEIKTAARRAARLNGITLDELRETVRAARRDIAAGADAYDVICSYCGEDAEDRSIAMKIVFRACGIDA